MHALFPPVVNSRQAQLHLFFSHKFILRFLKLFNVNGTEGFLLREVGVDSFIFILIEIVIISKLLLLRTLLLLNHPGTRTNPSLRRRPDLYLCIIDTEVNIERSFRVFDLLFDLSDQASGSLVLGHVINLSPSLLPVLQDITRCFLVRDGDAVA